MYFPKLKQQIIVKFCTIPRYYPNSRKQRELFLSEVNNKETIVATEANNSRYCLQKWIEKFPLYCFLNVVFQHVCPNVTISLDLNGSNWHLVQYCYWDRLAATFHRFFDWPEQSQKVFYVLYFYVFNFWLFLWKWKLSISKCQSVYLDQKLISNLKNA